jgi:hypothetical protein
VFFALTGGLLPDSHHVPNHTGKPVMKGIIDAGLPAFAAWCPDHDNCPSLQHAKFPKAFSSARHI